MKRVYDGIGFFASMVCVLMILAFFVTVPLVGWVIGKPYYTLPGNYEGWSPYGRNMKTNRSLLIIPVEVIALLVATYFVINVGLEGVWGFGLITVALGIWLIIIKRFIGAFTQTRQQMPCNN